MPERVLLLGVDGLAWPRVRAGVAQGRLPRLAELLRDGAYAELPVADCVPGLAGVVESLNSPTLWTTIATGQHYFQHGVYDFRNLLDAADPAPLFESRHVRSPRIWDVLSQYQKRSIVVGYYVTHPAYSIRGVMVSDLFGQTRAAGTTWPRAMSDALGRAVPAPRDGATLLAQLSGMPMDRARAILSRDASDVTRRLIEYRLVEPFQHDERVLHAFEHLMRRESWDFATVYLRLIDFVSHGFWAEGNRLPAEFVASYGGVVDAAYAWFDKVLGEIRARLAPGDRLIVLSDHGFKAAGVSSGPGDAHDIWDISYGQHAEPAFLAVSGGTRHGRIDGASLLDIAPTILDFFDVPQAHSLDGGILPGLLRAPSGARAAPVPAYDYTPPSESGDLSDEEQSQIMSRLAALGYMNE